MERGMAAMEAATNNAPKLIEGLTLYSNKVRQGRITKELIEVVQRCRFYR